MERHKKKQNIKLFNDINEAITQRLELFFSI